jgi:hypothetical protein
MKTPLISESNRKFLKDLSNKSGEIASKINNLCRDAIDEIVNLFEGLDIEKIDVESYSDDMLIIETYVGDVDTIKIRRVEYDEKIYVYDEDNEYHTSEEWFAQAPQLLNILLTAIEAKFEDIEKFKVGAKVRWIDPAIDDYDKDEREEALARVFTIAKCPEVIDLDSIILISDGYTEAEVPPMELVLAPENEG